MTRYHDTVTEDAAQQCRDYAALGVEHSSGISPEDELKMALAYVMAWEPGQVMIGVDGEENLLLCA